MGTNSYGSRDQKVANAEPAQESLMNRRVATREGATFAPFLRAWAILSGKMDFVWVTFVRPRWVRASGMNAFLVILMGPYG